MPKQSVSEEEKWRAMLTTAEAVPRHFHHLMGLLPASPRCKLCNAPFKSWGGALMRMTGRNQSKKNPRYCEPCEFQERGGAEVEISMLFADMRGSTTLAEQMAPAEFTALIARFYQEATDVLVQSDALVDRLVGDEVIGLFIPAFAGTEHARRAVEAGRKLIRRAGYGGSKSPWLPLGIGIHTGVAFVGVMQGADDGLRDFTALGDNVNITARLASRAAAGEVLVSEAALRASGLKAGNLERRTLNLKGKSNAVSVFVLHGGGRDKEHGG